MLSISNIKPDFIYRNKKPVAAIIDINVFNEIIEKLEDEEDITYLKTARENEMVFRDFDDFLMEQENIRIR